MLDQHRFKSVDGNRWARVYFTIREIYTRYYERDLCGLSLIFVRE